MTSNQFPVIDGPSKFDLSNALFIWKPRLSVIFNANCPVATAFEVFVLSVQAEDGSGESWSIEGVVGKIERPQRARRENYFLPESGQHVSLYFRTDSRQGHVKFFKKGCHHSLAELDQMVQRCNEQQYRDGRPVRL